MSQSYIDEGKEILSVIDKYFPKRFDGKESIPWLHKHSTQGKQDEWAAFFFEEYCNSLLTRFLGGWKGPRITNNKRFDYQRNYVWDLKLESATNKNGKKNHWIILNDIDSTKRVIQQETGIGYVVAEANFCYDSKLTFRRWRNKFENKTTRIKPTSRVLKKSGTITNILGVFLKDEKEINDGIASGWFGIFKQGRNSDNRIRKPKYKIKLHDVPERLLITL